MFHCSKIYHIRELYSDIISTNILDDNTHFRHLCSEDLFLKTSKPVHYYVMGEKSFCTKNKLDTLLTTLFSLMKLKNNVIPRK